MTGKMRQRLKICASGVSLHRQQTVEKCPVMLQRYAEILGRDVGSLTPLFFEFRPPLAEAFGNVLDRRGYQLVRILNRFPRFIDEACLDSGPACSKRFSF